MRCNELEVEWQGRKEVWGVIFTNITSQDTPHREIE